ncbi:uncharacterized protein LOC131601329 [Vicia villosa]|uniref:uncharacterized protein LOC131601329 n=1 Tax=Vicia villosa TaxID=3911 RepID=UPI00273B4F9A|nr:uncharacterized protein LOC131601329 [Vicia villosa]
MAQMLSFMKDIKDEQERAREARNRYEETPNDGNPLLGYVRGFDPHKSNTHSSKRVTKTHEEGEASHEGFIPATQKEGAPRTVRIPANNPPKDEDYVDLQYGEVDEPNQESQHKQTQADSEESARNNGQIKALEERLKAVEGYDTNPMPRHDGAVNAIEVVTEQEFVQQRSSPIDALKRYLLAKGFVLEHNEAFKTTLQRLVNQGVVQFKEYPEEEYVAMLDRNEPLMIPRQGARKTLIIPCAKATLLIPAQVHTRIIPVRDPYPVDKMKAVPWEYESNASTDVTNIVGPGGMTRSGRIFNTAKSKENSAQANDQDTVVPTERSTPIDKEITNKDAEEFLALIKKSDYKVVDQLHQTPSRISLLSLLIHSEKHRDTLMKILSAAHVTKDITVNQFDGMVANLTAGACLSFSEHELPSQGKEQNKALHISIQCGKAHLSRVLIDTGSSLNVMPKATLDKIDLEGLVIRPSRLVVKAFDGSQSPVFGEVDLPVVIGPHTFCINFQVMEIEPAYTCLLGRPWIHAAGAVTSTLHQKVKFVDGNSIVTVSGEEDIFVSNLDSYRYIEAGEKALETSFQALEIATAVTLPIEKTRRAGWILQHFPVIIGRGEVSGYTEVMSRASASIPLKGNQVPDPYKRYLDRTTTEDI